jgi:hypothetical protein
VNILRDWGTGLISATSLTALQELQSSFDMNVGGI